MARKVGSAPEPVSVVGLDVSLRCPAACLIPADWVPGEWGRLFSVSAEFLGLELVRGEREWHHQRIERLASTIVEWVGLAGPEVRVYVEDYAFGASGTGTREVAELTGVVKNRIYRELGLTVTPLNQSTIRKYFMGKLPPGKGKAALVHAKLAEAGAAFATADEGDAFLCANYGRTEHGLPGLTFGGVEAPVRPSRR